MNWRNSAIPPKICHSPARAQSEFLAICVTHLRLVLPQKKRPEPPKVDHPESLKNKTVLCNEMANSELLNNLCRLKKPVDSSLADLNCASQEVVRHFCNNSCHQENNRLCQMILQGFKTVIYWESLKETDVAGADVNGAEDNTKTTTKIIPDAPIPDSVPKNTEVSNSETIPKSNSFVQDTGIASKQLDKGLEMDEQLKLKKNTTDTPKLEPVQGTAPPLMGNTFGKDAVETVKTASELKTQPPPTKASPTSASNLNGMAKTEDEGKPLESSVKDEPNVDVLPQSPTQVFIIPPANDKKFAEDITIVENVSKYDDHYDMADPEDGEDDIVQPLTDGSEETNFGETRAPLVPKSPKPVNSVESLSEIDEPENTHFLLYFLTFVVLSATGYVLYQRRGRVFTFLVGGRGSRRRSSAGRGVNRSGSYKKLVNNLEEAMASSSVKNSNVIY